MSKYGVIHTSERAKKGIPAVYLKRLVQDGRLERIMRPYLEAIA